MAAREHPLERTKSFRSSNRFGKSSCPGWGVTEFSADYGHCELYCGHVDVAYLNQSAGQCQFDYILIIDNRRLEGESDSLLIVLTGLCQCKMQLFTLLMSLLHSRSITNLAGLMLVAKTHYRLLWPDTQSLHKDTSACSITTRQ